MIETGSIQNNPKPNLTLTTKCNIYLYFLVLKRARNSMTIKVWEKILKPPSLPTPAQQKASTLFHDCNWLCFKALPNDLTQHYIYLYFLVFKRAGNSITIKVWEKILTPLSLLISAQQKASTKFHDWNQLY